MITSQRTSWWRPGNQISSFSLRVWWPYRDDWVAVEAWDCGVSFERLRHDEYYANRPLLRFCLAPRQSPFRIISFTSDVSRPTPGLIIFGRLHYFLKLNYCVCIVQYKVRVPFCRWLFSFEHACIVWTVCTVHTVHDSVLVFITFLNTSMNSIVCKHNFVLYIHTNKSVSASFGLGKMAFMPLSRKHRGLKKRADTK